MMLIILIPVFCKISFFFFLYFVVQNKSHLFYTGPWWSLDWLDLCAWEDRIKVFTPHWHTELRVEKSVWNQELTEVWSLRLWLRGITCTCSLFSVRKSHWTRTDIFLPSFATWGLKVKQVHTENTHDFTMINFYGNYQCRSNILSLFLICFFGTWHLRKENTICHCIC